MGKVGIASNSGSIANLLYAPEPAACLARSNVNFSVILWLTAFICEARWLGQTTFEFLLK